ncbi:MAG TPA: class I SAM-dependent methyltransferase [Ramlibacter sp.]|nr:class I SAM-dependent methyltransferase [Ramlibacter sp.]
MTAPALDLAPLHSRIERYYSAKIERHGPTPPGVDWSCEPTQQLRFVQLLRLCDFQADFSLDDWGCGYGALLGFIGKRHPDTHVDYLGIDLSASMIEQARKLWRRKRNAVFETGERSPRVADYAVASGIFNVRIDEPLALWEQFVEHTLRAMALSTRRGFAVNFLAPLPEGMEGKPQLYRPAASRWAEFCERDLGMKVTRLERYGMREFTLLVRH